MAAKLQCEICGGELTGRPGGIFECDSCGMKFDTAWAKTKIQEIQGTVKVEGTVEVQGTVKVEGAVNKDSLLKRGYLALENRKWDDANSFFNEALNADAECAEAYLGLAMAEKCCVNKHELIDLIKIADPFRFESIHIANARRFGNESMLMWFRDYDAALDLRKKDAEKTQTKLALDRARAKTVANCIATGSDFIVGLCSNGTVLATGKNDKGQCDVSEWRGVVAIAAGADWTVGICSDGSAVSAGKWTVKREVSEWKDVAAVYASYGPIGIQSDGTVLGSNELSNCKDIVAICIGDCEGVLCSDGSVIAFGRESIASKAKKWRNVVELSGKYGHMVALCSDGTLQAAGDNQYGQCKVNAWRDIVAIATGFEHTVGLCSNGTVMAVGNNENGQCDVEDWDNIIEIAAGFDFTVGLRADGTVLAAGQRLFGANFALSEWNDVVAIFVADSRIVGLRNDGTVLLNGDDYGLHRWPESSEWKLFNNIDTIEQERLEAKERAERERRDAEKRAEQEHKEAVERAEKERQERITSLTAELLLLNTELSNLKGFFPANAGRRSRRGLRRSMRS